MSTLINQIEKIMTDNPGKIYSINDFYYLGTKNTIKSIFYRLNKENKITRLIDGLYTKPKYSKVLKEYSYPNPNDVALKIADKFSWSIAPTGETALNFVGLSTQISNEYIYISDGEYREYEYRDIKIIFKHTTNRTITNYSKKFSILIQAIKALGNGNVGQSEINKLSLYAYDIKDEINNNLLKLPFWIQEVLKRLKENESDGTVRNNK